VLPGYRRSYDLVDNALTPLEEAALAHVLCSPDTTYGDVAGQMYVVEEIVSKAQFELFQKLAARVSTYQISILLRKKPLATKFYLTSSPKI